MSRYNRAYSETIGDLKKRISEVTSKRIRQPAQDPVHGGEHEEPDGDEDAQGREPPGPEEVREVDLPEDPGEMELEGQDKRPLKAKESDDMNCNNCGGPGESDDKYCRHCGGKR